ncbi:TonB family protein [Chamaesiphon sp.]|uniref:TonB family protein n=1 Tax=Chamaesiphon sp. TaxID=2814140 RepID=UPI0035944708
MSVDFGATQRSVANRALTKILLMGLGGSTLLHTVTIAGISYWAHDRADEQMEIVEIDRVEVDPPSPTPSTKPIPIPEPKVVKSPVTASIPTPIPVKIPTPKAILTPVPVIKIAKSAAIKRSTSPTTNTVSPAVNRAAPPFKIATITPQKSNPTPSFPNKLFSDPLPKSIPFKPAIEARTQTPKTSPQPTKKVTQEIENNPHPSAPIKKPQSTAINQTVLAPNNPPAKLAPKSTPTNNLPTDEKLIPSSAGNTSKLAQTPDRTIPSENQTKSPSELASDLGSLTKPLGKKVVPNSPPRNDNLTEAPKNNTQIVNNNRQISVPTNNNSPVNLGGNPPKRSEIATNASNKDSGNRPNSNRDLMGGTPGNNTQNARNNGGDNSVKLGDQTNLGGGNRQGSIGSSSNGNDNGSSGGSNKSGTGTPGNMATGSSNRVSIQCLRNCEIRYPDELESSDIGKDKILVRVTIDPNGMITNAEIDRSSGNQNLDRVTLEGVKQMQLSATGKTKTYRIKVSTLLR